jgi:hypothetical protein
MELHELSKDGKWREMAGLVTDEMLDAFAVEADPADVKREVEATYGGVADRVTLPLEHAGAFT